MPPALPPCKSSPRRRISSPHRVPPAERIVLFLARCLESLPERAIIEPVPVPVCNPRRASHGPMQMPRGKETQLMANELGFQTSTLPGRVAAILILAALVLAFSLAAQQ